MTEKRKRIVTKIGDVFCAVIDDYKIYFQFIAIDRTQLSSSLVRVFKRKYSSDEKVKLENVVEDEVLFNVHVVIAWGIRMGLWEKVGKVRFDEPVRLPFKTFNNSSRSIGPWDWRVWYNNEPEIYITGPLPEEFVDAAWGGGGTSCGNN